MASYFITEWGIYNTPDNDSIVLEKCNFVHEKSLKSPWISFLKKCGNLVIDFFVWETVWTMSNISHSLVGNKFADPSDVAEASHVGADPTTSSFLT